MRRLVLLIVALSSACPPNTLVGQPCTDADEFEPCEGDTLLRCINGFYEILAECAEKCVSASGRAGVTHNTPIATDETWTCADGPHTVEGAPLNVAAGATLFIEAGALLRMQPASRISADPAGRIEATGTIEAPILVTAANGLAAGFGAGAEGGLNVFAVEGATPTPSVIRHVIIERATHGLGLFGLTSTANLPTIENNTFRDNEGFGILISCNEANAPIPDFEADGNQFFNNGTPVGNCE
jgi:hypothetical protein